MNITAVHTACLLHRSGKKRKGGGNGGTGSSTHKQQKQQLSARGDDGSSGGDSIDTTVIDQSSNEIRFGKNLAHVDKAVRDKTVAALR